MMTCLTSETAGVQLGKRLFPLASLPILIGILTQAGRQAGLVHAGFQAAFDALVGSFLLGGFIWWSAASLHATDQDRQRSMDALRAMRRSLERSVDDRTAVLAETNATLAETNAALQAEIAQRTRTEAELRISENRFRSLVEATAAIVWHTNPQGGVDDEHPAWTAFTGQSFEQLRGWGWLDSVHPDDREHTARLWSQALASQTLYEEEHRLRDREGSYRVMSVRGVPLRRDDGTVREWVGLHVDATQRRRAEAEVRLLSQLIDLANDAILIRQRGGA